jgi:drug/metabolite transporter (DMT)-like permease
MYGILLAFLTALFTSAKDAFTNKAVKKINEYLVAFSMSFIVIPLTIIPLLYLGFPEVGQKFWVALFFKAPLIATTFVCLAKAHKYSDMSLIIPLLSFTPIFMLPLAPIIAGQHITPMGLLGVSLIVVGVYVLKIKEKKEGFFDPIKAIFSEVGARYMFAVAFIYAFTSLLDARGVSGAGNDLQGALFWTFCVDICASIILFPMAIVGWKKTKKEFSHNIGHMIPIGLCKGIAEIFQMWAMALTLAVYVNCIKRTCIIISVLIGHLIFKEKGIKERIPAAIIMTIGVIFIIMASA